MHTKGDGCNLSQADDLVGVAGIGCLGSSQACRVPQLYYYRVMPVGAWKIATVIFIGLHYTSIEKLSLF